MKIKKRTFGVLSSGQKMSLYTISNGKMSFSVTDMGCAITSILLPDPKFGTVDVVLGFSTFEGYARNFSLFGSLVGRYAGRISGASFPLGEERCQLQDNDNGNCLHGGYPNFAGQIWNSAPFQSSHEAGVLFSRTSPAGEQGFPGNLDVRISVSLTDTDDICLHYRAKTDAPTPVNLTNHTYFNLAGWGTVMDHRLQLFADRYIETGADRIPTGAFIDVAGTPFDFRTPRTIGSRFAEVPGGYDHTWEINRSGELLNPVAMVEDPESGRGLTVHSTQPACQLYTANHFSKIPGKGGEPYDPGRGFCLETQHFPDSPNRPEFPDTILLPGDRYRHQTVWHFDYGNKHTDV